jgi:hypothetical protein
LRARFFTVEKQLALRCNVAINTGEGHVTWHNAMKRGEELGDIVNDCLERVLVRGETVEELKLNKCQPVISCGVYPNLNRILIFRCYHHT